MQLKLSLGKLKIMLTLAMLFSLLGSTTAFARSETGNLEVSRLKGTMVEIVIQFPGGISGSFSGSLQGKHFDCAAIESDILYCVGPFARWVEFGTLVIYDKNTHEIVLEKVVFSPDVGEGEEEEEEDEEEGEDGEDEETPPDGGGEETPPDDGGEETPPDGGGEETPPDGGGEETPPDGGGEETPPDGGGEETPPDGGGEETPPDGGGEETPPDGGGEETPPDEECTEVICD